MSGRQLAERLVAARPELQVLYMSGLHRRRGRPARRAGRARPHFLQKPFTPAALARKVREVLGSVSGNSNGTTDRDLKPA